MSAQATKCPVTRDAFMSAAKGIQLTLNGMPVLLEVREFSTGSFGWYANGKVTLDVGGVPVKVQMGLNLTVVGSKEAPRS